MFAQLSRPQRVAYGIIAVLAVLFLGLLVYLGILRGGEQAPTTGGTPVSVSGLRPEVAAKGFDVKVLSDPRYTELNTGLFDAGRVPVQAPASRGKPNLF